MALAVTRCWWPGEDDLYLAYHDDEWGRPSTDRTDLFEKLALEGFQAGLSWITVLRKRGRFRERFHGFVPEVVANMGPDDVEALMGDAGIIRNRAKIEAAISNARALLDLERAGDSLVDLVWSFEPDPANRPPLITREVVGQLATTPESVALSKALKRRGFRFVGPTTAYAFMQAMGIVNDHVDGCPQRDICLAERKALTFSRARS
ncbi:MAG: DNA-3-methyladenine glycosylase I [Acidimicrobiia bacterium]|nr:DNA-3-methyladenine glycosylase I [Acidimicrobiia bacterium]